MYFVWRSHRLKSRMGHWFVFSSLALVLLALLQCRADIVLLNQTSAGKPVAILEYVHARFGPFDFQPIVGASLLAIPRDCSLSWNSSSAGRYIAMWERSGMLRMLFMSSTLFEV